MEALPTPYLRLAEETGELLPVDIPATILELRDQVAGLQHTILSQAATITNLKRNREREMQDHALFPQAKEAFDYWREKCRHPGSKLSTDRFFTVEPYLRKYGLEMVKRAIDGAAFDPFVTRRKNGSVKRHDGWDLIFRNGDKFEEFCNRAPRKEE